MLPHSREKYVCGGDFRENTTFVFIFRIVVASKIPREAECAPMTTYFSVVIQRIFSKFFTEVQMLRQGQPYVLNSFSASELKVMNSIPIRPRGSLYSKTADVCTTLNSHFGNLCT